jgi:ribosomal protein S18 acetylase RimI-like enzyme
MFKTIFPGILSSLAHNEMAGLMLLNIAAMNFTDILYLSMNYTLQISKAEPNDIAALVILVNSAYRGEQSKKGWTTEADLLGGIRIDENSLSDMINKPHALILKYVDIENRITGCVYLQKQQQKLYLGMLTVLPEWQAAGIGKQLLTASENYASSVNCSSVIMTVISVRKELIAWYERRGYKNTGETRPFPNDPAFGIAKQPLEFIVMEKILW